MQRQQLLRTSILSVAGLAAAASSARAVPVSGQFVDDSRCDTLPTIDLTHELGDVNTFPINEAIGVVTQPASFTVCVPDDGLANDWLVEIRNLSGIPWVDLFFVVDFGASLGNADGYIVDVLNAPTPTADAMRIDGTVTLGGNANLISESMGINEIFEPGEVWVFNVSNFNNNASVNDPPILLSPGVFAGSSPLGQFPGNSSILANPIPEPGALALTACGAATLLLHRRRRS